MNRPTQIVILCEDQQSECFARRFLLERGCHHRSFRVVPSPRGQGSGEQWVRERFLAELLAYRLRQARAETCLLVMTDADTGSPAQRLTDFQRVCAEAGVDFRQPGERVAFIVPARNIESWLAFLTGQDTDENMIYPKLPYPSDCQRAVEALAAMCRAGGLCLPAPDSLRLSCEEFERLGL